METQSETLSKRERAELAAYVGFDTVLARALLFGVLVAIVGYLSWAGAQAFAPGSRVWIVAPALFGGLLYR